MSSWLYRQGSHENPLDLHLWQVSVRVNAARLTPILICPKGQQAPSRQQYSEFDELLKNMHHLDLSHKGSGKLSFNAALDKPLVSFRTSDLEGLLGGLEQQQQYNYVIVGII